MKSIVLEAAHSETHLLKRDPPLYLPDRKP